VQVHVVIVQPGQHGPAGRVKHVLAGPRGQRVGHIVDAHAHPDVDNHTI
jgi:hypothetical protein